MEVKTARRNHPVFNRLGGGQTERNQVCKFWLEGRCNRNPCRFMHRLEPPLRGNQPKHFGNQPKHSGNMAWRNPKISANMVGDEGRRARSIKNVSCDDKLVYDKRKGGDMDCSMSTHSDALVVSERTEIDKVKVQDIDPNQCKVSANKARDEERRAKSMKNISYDDELAYEERKGGYTDSIMSTQSNPSAVSGITEIDEVEVQESDPNQCKSCCQGSAFTMLATLEGHSEAISGISLPSGHDKLYSGGKDGCIRVWDCHSGQCAGLVNANDEVGSLITIGPWLFVGLHNAVKAWNLESAAEFTLNGTGGLVCSLVANDDMLFAGTEDGSILVWKWQPGANVPEPAVLLKEHNGVVGSLLIGGEVLYSGSADHTIKVWDIRNFKCLLTMRGHTREVTGLFGFESCLLSASRDNTLKVWGQSGNGAAEVIHEIKSDHGINAICGVHDAGARPILLCSYDDNSIRLYDLPLFEERGRMLSKRPVTTIQMGPDGLFFTGDAAGEITVCKLLDSPCSKNS